MKKIILASALIAASFANLAFAGEVCGTLGSYSVAPHCPAGQACPMFVRLQYEIVTSEGTHVDLETSSTPVFDRFEQFNGNKVCVTGSNDTDSFEVTEITIQ
jgi:hypothetical protein